MAQPALAETCRFDNGRGASLAVEFPADTVTVDFGDWTEICQIMLAERHPNLGFGSGWLPASIAQCGDDLAMPIIFVQSREGGEFDIVVLDGMAFYRRCRE